LIAIDFGSSNHASPLLSQARHAACRAFSMIEKQTGLRVLFVNFTANPEVRH
jgi:hypothetical protein